MGREGELFEGQPAGLPDPIPHGSSLYRPGTDDAVRVRHVGRYGRFVDFCARHGARADELAADPEGLIWFLYTSGTRIRNDGRLRAAAAVFAGNTIIRLRPDAQWTADEKGSPVSGNRRKQFGPDRLLVGLLSADDESVRRPVSVLSDWAGEEADGSPAMQSLTVSPPAGQPRYLRPPLPATTYCSDEGKPVPYGRRWGTDGPDPESYGIDRQPERLAGLHLVARALVEYLAAVYDVGVRDPALAREQRP